MKYGRNAPCPCGSGEKYKKCCLRLSDNPISLDCGEFKHIIDKAVKVREIMRPYAYEDLVIAVYCLNSWRKNRSALAQSLTLNLALYSLDSSGEKRIFDYNELCSFFNAISTFVSITPNEDYIIDDYGEIFITFEGKQYPVITGTGYLQTYASLQYASSLMKLTHHEKEFITLLEYQEFCINNTASHNTPNVEEQIAFELPSSSFWTTIKTLFVSPEFKSYWTNIVEIIRPIQTSIEHLYFVYYQNNPYPVYNTALLLDYYNFILNTVPPSQHITHIENTILSLLDDTYNPTDNTTPQVLLKPRIVDDTTKKTATKAQLLFAAHDNNKMLIALLNCSSSENTNPQTAIQITQELHANDSLALVEDFIRNNNPGPYGTKIGKDLQLMFLLITPFTNITSSAFHFQEENVHFSCTALDLFYLLGFSNDFSEIIDFMRYDLENKAQVFCFGGKSNLFFTWKSLHHQISAGAIEYTLIQPDFNHSDSYVLSWFREQLKYYPRNACCLFDNPLVWSIKTSNPPFCEIQHKGIRYFGGATMPLDQNSYLFLSYNATFFEKEDFDTENYQLFSVIDELNHKLFARHNDLICNIPLLKGKILQLIYIPWKHAHTHNYSKNFMQEKGKDYVFCDACIDRDIISIRFSVHERLLQALKTSSDRTVENQYFLELLKPILIHFPQRAQDLENSLKTDSSKLRTVGVFTIEQEYYHSFKAIDIPYSELDLARVRKEIAQISYSQNILPGEYHGQEATQTIRKMQTAVVQAFEHHVAAFDKSQLHMLTLNYYSIQQHGIIVHLKRYNAFSNLDPTVQAEFEQETRKLRQLCRRNANTAEYLIETNLSIHHLDNTNECTENDLRFLMAFADWLVVLQENADLCHYTDQDVYINVDSDYRINTLIADESKSHMDDLVSRRYNTESYHIKGDEHDQQFMKRVRDAFLQDTGIDLGTLFDLLTFMRLELPSSNLASEIYPNVFSIPRNAIRDSFTSLLEKPLSLSDLDRLLDFITINENQIKTVDGCTYDILPIWEREKRDNRFEVKPLLLQNDQYVFSPVSLHTLLLMWRNGMPDWFLPYEIGLPSVKVILDEWKKHYEDVMVQDIAKLFKDASFDLVLTEVELCSRFPKSSYPRNLGDYDVLAYSSLRNELWIIESKVIHKVASVFEDQMQQKGFFFQKKYDSKFQRRIDYAIANLNKLLSSLKITSVNCKLVPYMVTNKLFSSRYKTIEFEIINFHELKTMLEKTKPPIDSV